MLPGILDIVWIYVIIVVLIVFLLLFLLYIYIYIYILLPSCYWVLLHAGHVRIVTCAIQYNNMNLFQSALLSDSVGKDLGNTIEKEYTGEVNQNVMDEMKRMKGTICRVHLHLFVYIIKQSFSGSQISFSFANFRIICCM